MSDYGSTPPPPPPSFGYGAVQGTPPPNYLVWAIVAIIFCWPLAIPSIVFSTQVNSKWTMGDVAGAQDASKKAKMFAMWATIVGVVGVVLYVLFFVLLATASNTLGS
jgi:hypothetical protein